MVDRAYCGQVVRMLRTEDERARPGWSRERRREHVREQAAQFCAELNGV